MWVVKLAIGVLNGIFASVLLVSLVFDNTPVDNWVLILSMLFFGLNAYFLMNQVGLDDEL